jgi:hypothetical protein
MTAAQALALAFPAITTIALSLFAYGLTKWIGRKKAKPAQPSIYDVGIEVAMPELRQSFEEIDRLAQRALKKIPTA